MLSKNPSCRGILVVNGVPTRSLKHSHELLDVSTMLTLVRPGLLHSHRRELCATRWLSSHRWCLGQPVPSGCPVVGGLASSRRARR